MFGLYVTPTEALLQVAQQYPYEVAVRSGADEWSYAALWDRVRKIADELPGFDDTRNPIGLHMGLEIDFVAAAHAIWLSGRTVVFLSLKWTPDVLRAVLERANVHVVLFGVAEPPTTPGVRAITTFSLVASRNPPTHVVPPLPSEVVQVVPLICSITPTSGSTGVPKSIVYPMRRSLEVLSEESSTLLQPMDGQWLRGGTTFLRPLFEIRRFMFNRTTLYLDPSTSVTDQCAALCEELESQHNSQPLRVYFTPSVFRAFADFTQMRAGGSPLPSGFNRVYWMVIGGESLSIRDLELARATFPSATIACNYACSEVGFAGISQMFIHPSDPMPSTISFGATQGCTDLVLLGESISAIPKTAEGATGIIAFITRQSATHYLANEEASRHAFRPWDGDDTLLYTDDIGCMQADGRIVIRGRSSRNVKINGLFVDLDYVERALAPALADKSLLVTGFRLVKSNATEKIVLFASTETTDAMFLLKHIRSCLRASYGDTLAMVISSVRCIPEMPFNASYKIDLAKLQNMADSVEPLAPNLFAELPVVAHSSRVDALADEIAALIVKLSKSPDAVQTDMPLLYTGLNSITAVRLYMWLQLEHEYEESMVHLFDEGVTARSLATEILGEDVTDEADEIDILAGQIATEITKLSKSSEPVSKDTPLLYSGLNSITAVRLYMWLQSEHEYEEELAHLFAEQVTAEVLAKEILGYVDDVERGSEDGLTDSSSDTAVEDDSSELHMLEKNSNPSVEDISVETELLVHVADGLVHEFTIEDDDIVPTISVQGPDSKEAHDIAIDDALSRIVIVKDNDLDREVEVVENEEGADIIVSYRRPPRTPSADLDLQSTPPLRYASTPFDVPVSPLELSPLSGLFSSWITLAEWAGTGAASIPLFSF